PEHAPLHYRNGRPRSHTRRTISPVGNGRGKWLGLCVLAIFGIASCSSTSTSPTAATAPSTSKTSKTSNTSKHTGLVETSYKPGDCVIWTDGSDETDTHVVGCGAPHRIQITGSVDVGKTVTTEPTDEKWHQLLTALCPPTVSAYLGRQVDPLNAGPYGLGA